MQYRTNGAIGALLDEYERAIKDLKSVLSTVTDTELITIVDTQTDDEDCRSIQTIMAHVVRSGYGYAITVRSTKAKNWSIPKEFISKIVTHFVMHLIKCSLSMPYYLMIILM